MAQNIWLKPEPRSDCSKNLVTPDSSLAIQAIKHASLDTTMANAKNAAAEVRSAFLELPGELRNQIYEYVLTADRPFEYRAAHTSTGAILNELLCLVQEDGEDREDHKDREGRENHDEHETHATKNACTSTTPKPLSRVELVIATSLAHVRPKTQVFNRLKQVNRQLRFETADLEYRYNTILFLDPTYYFPLDAPHALTQLSSLTQHVQSSPHPWLTSVTIVSPDDLVYDLAVCDPEAPSTTSHRFNAYLDYLAALAAFCRTHPTVQVNYAQTAFSYMHQFSGLHGACGTWIFAVLGTLLNVVFDPSGSFATRMLSNPRVANGRFMRLARQYAREFEGRKVFTGVRNLRMFPGNPQAMRARYGEGGVKGTDLESPRRCTERALRWAVWATKWVNEGVRPC